MSPTISYTDLKPLFYYPIQECFETDKVFQVDQLWTILPTICTGYWALLPLWPSYEDRGGGAFRPYVPEEATHLAHDFSPRALLMLGLTVCTIPPD
ncbi:hypothetical protein EDB87DRAFT_1628451 [Lactarius vividus]|nr:hypothetical protein EDB87DRAFT_1628451 [Lactarius vividus]